MNDIVGAKAIKTKFVIGAVAALGVLAMDTQRVSATINDVNVANSHSNINPQESVAFVAKAPVQSNNVPEIKATPITDNSKTDILIMPAGLTDNAKQAWMSEAKTVATQDYVKTGRVQKIISVDATVKTFTIGDTSVPAVSAIDVASYQSWMKQADYNNLAKVGVKAIVVKVTEGSTYKNKYSANQIALAKKAGMTVSVYHYARFTNSATAISEAKQTADKISELGLSKNTMIFADMEAPSTINASSVKSNLNKYWSTLSNLGYRQHGVYTSANYSATGSMVSTVGDANTWIAQYPYTPSKSSLLHSEYGAWQFSSTAQVPSASSKGNYIDVSHDYNGLLLKGTTTSSKPPVTTVNKYIAIKSNDSKIYSNFSGSVKGSTSAIYQQTLLAKFAYQVNATTVYYSVYDNKGAWKGYVDSKDTKSANKTSGAAFTFNKYVTVTGTGTSYWKDFSWDKAGDTNSLYHKTYLAKFVYSNFNGSKYYSLYDTKGKWVGYLNTKATRVADNRSGAAFTVNQYVTVTARDTAYWKSFSWVKKGTTADLYRKTYLAKYVYCNFNGSQYYSMYDNKGKWVGYVNTKAVRVNSGRQGAAFTVTKRVSVTSKTGVVWKNFDWVKRGTLASYYGKTVVAKFVYENFNGSEYLSLYTNDGKWIGYANAAYTTY